MRGTPVSYFDYSGGRNTRDAPYLLTEKQCRDQLNVHTSLSGDIEKRTGFVQLATVSGAPVSGTGVHTLFPANTSTKSLLGVASTATKDKIFKMTTAGTATVLKSELTANTRWWFAQADVNAGEGPIFGLNGVDTPQRWNGSAASTSDWVATTGTVPKKAKFLTYFSSRLWALEGSRLWYSGITGSTPDPMNWDTENYVDLDPNDGQEGTGIGIVGSYLVVFKPRKVYVVYDPITGANRQVSHEIGCIAPRSIVQTPIGLLFLSEDQGVCVTDGETVKPISEEIEPDLREVASSPTTAALAAGILDGERYQLSISLGGTQNDHTLEYDLQNKSWWLHDCASNQFALLDPGGTPQLYSADPSAARVDRAFVAGTFADHGAAYVGGSYWASPWRAWGVGGGGADPHVTKRINEIRIDGVGNWDAYVATDFDEVFEAMEGETWEAANAGATFEEERVGGFEEAHEGTFEEAVAATVTMHYLTPALGRSFSMKYVNNDTANFRIYSETIALTGRSN
jgi:hypothetical protein